MSTHARSHSRSAVLSLSAASLVIGALFVAGCGNTAGSGGGSNPGQSSGSAFVIGTDAPVASVVSFDATIQSVDAIDASGNSVSLVSGNPTIDFARYNGLQTLMDENNVKADTYTQISVTFASATIGYLQMNAGAAPTVQTMNATFTTPTTTVTLANPLIVSQTGPVGIRMDFRLDKSIQVTNGAITGQVTPTLDITAVGPSDPGAYIDEFDTAVVSVDTSSQSFIVQGPHGRQWTINVNGNTEWDNNEGLSDLTSTSIVQISGVLDKADSTIDADEVAILSQNGFYAGGTVTYVQPSSGVASDFQMYVRGTLPAQGDGVSDGDLAQVNLSGSEKFFIYWMHNRFTEFLFNSSTLLPGQHISVGGPLSGAQNPDALSVNRVVLRGWGFNGTIVPGSLDSGSGTFQMNVTGFAGLLIPQTVTVYTASGTSFRYGFSGLGDLSSATNIRVVGLLIKDPTSGDTVLLARYIDDMD
ncbi:MAG TPA: DUF4382 domain-containing protein [Acidobacteriaceae bacterium]|jgi:hypothetical protein|nr:DUF4382 domain-containing protein [Acidobacteriaceae bacterium]